MGRIKQQYCITLLIVLFLNNWAISQECVQEKVVYDRSNYFYDGFDYCNYESFKESTQDKIWYWSNRSNLNHDLDGNGKIDNWEKVKSQEIVTNFGKTNNTSLKIESYRPIDFSSKIAKYAPANWKEIWQHNSKQIIQDLDLDIDINTTVKDLSNLYAKNKSLALKIIELIEPWWDKRHIRTVNDNYNIMTHNDISRPDYSKKTNLVNNKDYWFHYAVYIPNEEDFPLDLKSNPDIIGQWHHNSWHNNKIYNSPPPISLRLVKDQWQVWIDNGNSELTGAEIVKIPITQLERNTWLSFKFLINFSERLGKCHVWLNDEKFVSYNGKTVYNEVYGDQPSEIGYKKEKVVMDYYLLMGLYKATWYGRSIADRRIFYIDDVWVSEIDQSPSIGKALKKCNKTLVGDRMFIETYELNDDNHKYKFRIESSENKEVKWVSSYSNKIDLVDYPPIYNWLDINELYFVTVQKPNHPVYYKYSNSICKIRTPPKFGLSIIEEDCGKKITRKNKRIRTKKIGKKVKYRFRINCPSTNETKFVTTKRHKLNLYRYSDIKKWLKPSTEYRVSVKVLNHSIFNEYGETRCSIFTE